MNISVVIPTYRNEKGLVENLKRNMPYFKGCEVIVVNDDPTTFVLDAMSYFPEVTLIENKNNRGFSGAVNTGVNAAKNAYVFLCNDDVLLKDAQFTSLISQFEKDRHLFAISLKQIEKDGSPVGKNIICWKDGFIQHSKAHDITSGVNGWAEGGASLVDAAKFRGLGGFDELYRPFYWEDIDLSYRAWKKGYVILFTNEVEVEHHHETTISKHFSKNYITAIAYRNQLIFIWKNISSLSLIITHTFALLKRIIRSILTGDRAFLSGFVQAAIQFPFILFKRLSVPHNVTDHEILNQFTKN